MADMIFKKPSPQSVMGGGEYDFSKYSPTQQQYLQTLAGMPSEQELYGQLSEKYGIPDKLKVVEGLQRSILDLEGKIGDVEANVGERIKGFDVTEAQRQRRVAVEEQPLRDQYLEALRRQEGAQAGLTAARGLLSDEIGAYQSAYQRPLSVLEAMLGFEKGTGMGTSFPTLPDAGYDEFQAPQYSPAQDGLVSDDGMFVSQSGRWVPNVQMQSTQNWDSVFDEELNKWKQGTLTPAGLMSGGGY